MAAYEFHTRNIEWGLAIMASERYTMPNGRDSHAVAAEVIHASDDALLAIGVRYTANGQRKN